MKISLALILSLHYVDRAICNSVINAEHMLIAPVSHCLDPEPAPVFPVVSHCTALLLNRLHGYQVMYLIYTMTSYTDLTQGYISMSLLL